jgi:hypothetical protein
MGHILEITDLPPKGCRRVEEAVVRSFRLRQGVTIAVGMPLLQQQAAIVYRVLLQ